MITQKIARFGNRGIHYVWSVALIKQAARDNME